MNKYIIFLMICSSLVGCSKKSSFLVCPPELSSQLSSEQSISKKREMLTGLDYRILAVHINKKGELEPVIHYRPEHTFGNRLLSLEVSFSNPLTISTMIIIDQPINHVGVAVKLKKDREWRIHWISDTDLTLNQNTYTVYLPDYNTLSILKRTKEN